MRTAKSYSTSAALLVLACILSCAGYALAGPMPETAMPARAAARVTMPARTAATGPGAPGSRPAAGRA